ncbi:MAG: class I SAM-dependent methyltransferase, partial [Actinomycetota bacterium]
APRLAEFARVERGQRVLDVGCGPGALTAELVVRLGAPAVSAVDPSEPFVTAARARHPEVDVRLATAEDLPFRDATFDATLAQLVVHFMPDPVAGIAEMTRVTRPGGAVAACTWDFEGDRAPISVFWQVARELHGAEGESGEPGTRPGQLSEYFEAAGLGGIEEAEISATVDHATFEEWWDPFTLGVGPAGTYARSLEEAQLSELRERCRQLLGEPPFTPTAVAWAALGQP